MQEQNLSDDTANRTTRPSFTIYGNFYGEKCFPDLNNLLSEAGKNPMAYGRMKKKYEFLATNAMRKSLGHWRAKGKVRLHFWYGEPSKGQKRDYDNITSASKKIICDALVKAGYIKDDKPQYLALSVDEEIKYVSKPYIRVEIEEVTE